MVAFAREMRWAIVGSGTRNAAAISAVVRPPTARRVSAIALAGVSESWQARKSRARLSSSLEDRVSASSGSWSATFPSRARRLASLR